MKIIKKDGRLEDFDFNKIKIAVQKSAARVDTKLSEDQLSLVESTTSNESSTTVCKSFTLIFSFFFILYKIFYSK